jgi:ABC-type cobalamin/Fe3+-siderophores transport system ATPase subunit
VTHHLSLVMELCERAVLMNGGKKIDDLPLEALMKNRDLLEDFGFDADLAQWMFERIKASRVINKSNK